MSTVVPGTLVDADPLLAAAVKAIIAHPVAVQRPDLVHFQPQAAAAANTPRGGDGGSALTVGATASKSPLFPWAVIPLVAVALVSLLAQLGSRILRRRLGRRLVLASLLVALSAVSVAVALTLVASRQPAFAHSAANPVAEAAATTPVETAPRPGMLAGALREHALAVPVGSASTAWTSLVLIESAVATEQDRVAIDEQQIAGITRELGTQDSTPATPGHRDALDPATQQSTLQDTLQHVVDDHQAAVSAYNASLQSEYSFYVSAAQSPQKVHELQSITSHVPPQVHTAVTTDLNLVQTQLQQEAQIAAAEAAAAAETPASTTDATAGGSIDAQTLAQQTAPQFHSPVGGVITQPFGPTAFTLEPSVTYAGTFYPHFHTGLDIAAPLDTPVGTAAAGTVILATSSLDSAGHLSGYGNYVVIAHGGGLVTLYGHLDKLLVTAGEMVRQGQVIGLLGSTGWSTGPHVHFEIRKNGVYVDPAPFLASELRP